MAVVRSLTQRKVPRRMAWQVMIPKKISTMLSHEHPVGVKCSVTRWFCAYVRGAAFSSAVPAESLGSDIYFKMVGDGSRPGSGPSKRR
jgi:hypothetical protein